MGERSWPKEQLEIINRRTMENFVFLNSNWLKKCDGKRHTIGCAPKTVSRVMFAKRIRQAKEYGLIVYAGKSNLRGKTDYVLTKKGRQMLHATKLLVLNQLF